MQIHLSQRYSMSTSYWHIAMVHILRSIEDERVFLSLNFMKDKQRKQLDSHLNLVMGLQTQNVYTLEDFSL